MKRKNGYVFAQRDMLCFVSHVYFFKQVCPQDKGIWTTGVNDVKDIYIYIYT